MRTLVARDIARCVAHNTPRAHLPLPLGNPRHLVRGPQITARPTRYSPRFGITIELYNWSPFGSCAHRPFQSVTPARHFHHSAQFLKDEADDDDSRPLNGGDDPNSESSDIEESSGGLLPLKPDGIQRPAVPEKFSPVIALPITRRPLFPGFYKTVTIRDPVVVRAIKDACKANQPYIATFLLKDDDEDKDMIGDLNDVHRVGTFAQITNMFNSGSIQSSQGGSPLAGTDGEASSTSDDQILTAILYPHYRVRLTSLVQPGTKESSRQDEDGADKKTRGRTRPNATKKSPIPSGGLQSPHSYLSWKLKLPLAHVEPLKDEPVNKKNSMVRAVSAEIVNVFKDIAGLNPLFRDQIAAFSLTQNSPTLFDDPARLADFTAAISGGADSGELQSVLESMVIEERLRKALQLLKKELVIAQLQSKIAKDVESKIAKRQREHFLMEQLKGIKKELGLESDGKDSLVEDFIAKKGKLKMPTDVEKVFDEEIGKLQNLEPASSEFNVTRNYLDWLTSIPWGQYSKEELDIPRAEKVLNEDHYGLKDVKDRILEFIAVGRLRGTVEGKIICLSGPPGVGKTSIGKSIARALGREFFRFSVGGLSDVAEIKGHRRTYVGAMPGKLVQALKKVKTSNPLILIDEVDKLGRGGYQGDPASALLELLDPEQNVSFLDHYMDVPIDLSKVLFVCTANITDTIPGPLLDRMEVITLSGYIADEKQNIALKYLIPQAIEASGFYPKEVKFKEDAVDELIRHYCREAGVRALKKYIERAFRKVALMLLKEHPEKYKDRIIQRQEEQEKLKEAARANFETNEKDNDVQIADISLEGGPGDGVTQADVSEDATRADQIAPMEVSVEESQNHTATQSEMPEESSSAGTDTPVEVSEASALENDASQEDQGLDLEARNSGTEVPDVSARSEEGEPQTEPTGHGPKVPHIVEPSYVISKDNLKDLVGNPLFTSDRLFDMCPPGVVMGLAWTSLGGSALYIESITDRKPIKEDEPGSGALSKVTGQIGEVMHESSSIAYTFSKHFVSDHFPENDYFAKRSIHLHVPEGAVPKDGPSAGITMTTSLISLALNEAVSPNLAMTGELTLTGKVLKIGGLKEKTIAAKRSGVETILFPLSNLPEWKELPDNVTEGIKGVPVDWYHEVFAQAFPKVKLNT